MSVVYVTNQVSTVDYLPLAHYGPIVFASRGHRHPSDPEVIRSIATALIQSKSEDYLAVTGHRLESAIAIATWLQLHETIPMLVLADNKWHLVPLSKHHLRIESEKIRDILARR